MSREMMIREAGLDREEASWFTDGELREYVQHKLAHQQRAHGHAGYTPREVLFDAPPR
jgi:hypothetical protein